MTFSGTPALLLLAFFLAPALTGPGPAAADEDLARRTFENADQLLREGKVEQALRDFEQVYTAYPDSRVADDAIYRLAHYYYPAESFDDLGSAKPEGIGKAKELLAKLNAKYPREDGAPRALFKLGLLALEPANPRRSLDEAYASFSSIINIYPDSDVVDRALFGAGYADFHARRYDKAAASFLRVVEEHPGSAVWQRARLQLALAHERRGAPVRALQELQALRDAHPEGGLAAQALDRLTQIYKMKVRPGMPGAKSSPLFTHDPGYAPALDPEALRGEVSLALAPDSTLRLLDLRSGTLTSLGHDGKKLGRGAVTEGARAVWVDLTGLEIVAAGDRIRAGSNVVQLWRQEGEQSRPLEGVVAAVSVGPGEIALRDAESNEVLLYDGDPVKLKVLYRDPEGRARLSGLAAGAEGKVYTLDRRARRILEIWKGGKPREIPGGPSQASLEALLQDPAALAADDIGNLFVLDRRTDTVAVITVEGKLLASIVSSPGTPSDFSYASAMAVGSRSEVYIYDAKRRTILRFW